MVHPPIATVFPDAAGPDNRPGAGRHPVPLSRAEVGRTASPRADRAGACPRVFPAAGPRRRLAHRHDRPGSATSCWDGPSSPGRSPRNRPAEHKKRRAADRSQWVAGLRTVLWTRAPRVHAKPCFNRQIIHEYCGRNPRGRTSRSLAGRARSEGVHPGADALCRVSSRGPGYGRHQTRPAPRFYGRDSREQSLLR